MMGASATPRPAKGSPSPVILRPQAEASVPFVLPLPPHKERPTVLAAPARWGVSSENLAPSTGASQRTSGNTHCSNG